MHYHVDVGEAIGTMNLLRVSAIPSFLTLIYTAPFVENVSLALRVSAFTAFWSPVNLFLYDCCARRNARISETACFISTYWLNKDIPPDFR